MLGIELSQAHWMVLAFALFAACAFEFINGFHDTANAVATVIYTKSMKPWAAVIWSGLCNFLGVFLGGISVALGIIKLLPPELLATQNMTLSLILVMSMLCSAIVWNLGTWYLGLPASSSHTLIGAILGIGLAHSLQTGGSLASGLNWAKVTDIGLSLLLSPFVGMTLAGLLLLGIKAFTRKSIIHQPPTTGRTPPWPVRATLIATSTGVSLAHGSNDGQKGVGLIMLILIAVLPSKFALSPDLENTRAAQYTVAAHSLANSVSLALMQPLSSATPSVALKEKSATSTDAILVNQSSAIKPTPRQDLAQTTLKIDEAMSQIERGQKLTDSQKLTLRAQVMKLEKVISKLEKSGDPMVNTQNWATILAAHKTLKKVTEYAPQWVLIMVALSIGLGTMIGWKRIVVTLGEKIGKVHMTYAQGAAAELVGASTIMISAFAGLPVSTTHVLSSGIAGTMIANKSGLHFAMVKKILLAWVFTLPASITLSALFYTVFVKIFL